jgi:biofilm protein TabA
MKKWFYPLWIAFLLINFQSQAQSGNKWTKKQADQWYNNQKWLNGLSSKPHPATDREEFARQYQANPVGWDKAFAYLKETDLSSLKPGKYPIDGEQVYVTVTEGPAKELDKTKWEAHRLYSDIHYVVKGKEKIGVAPVAAAQLTEAYDPAKDIMFYTAKGNFYLAEPGTFLIISPKYAHRPSIKVNGDGSVKKVVVKIRTSASN